MLTIRSILAPTDFSHHAEGAVRYACGLAARFGSTLHLLHVLSDVVLPPGPEPMLVPVLPPEFYAESEAKARATLEHLIAPEWDQPPEVITETRWGTSVDEIVAYATERGIDLVVIATHGRTGLSHILLGSVAERIVREAPCPVLTIRDRERSS